MADDKVQIVIEVDAAQAQATLEQFGSAAVKSAKKADDSFSGLQSVFKGVSASLIGMVGGFAAITKAIGEAAEEEKNIRALGLALAGTGEYTKEAVKNFQEYADALSANTGIDDAAILSTVTLAKSFGITNEQAKNLTTAAINLSAVTGQDLESAARQLGGTFDGTLEKLGNLGSEFRNLTKEQKEHGAVIDLVNQKYGEAGKAIGDTFEGSLNKLKKSFDDAFKSIGRSILQEGTTKQSIDVLVKSLDQLAPILAEITKIMILGTKTIATGFATIGFAATAAIGALAEAAGLDSVAETMSKANVSMANLLSTLTAAPVATDSATKSVDKFDETLVKLSASSVKSGKLTGLALEEFRKKAADLAAAGERFKSGILGNFGEQTEKETQKAVDALASVDKALKEGIISAEFAADAKIRINKDLQDKITKQNSDAIEKRQRLEAEAAKNAEEQVSKRAAIIGKVVGFAGQGKEGAKGAIAAGAGAAANAVLPGSGALAEQVVLLLASGKVAGAFVKEFIKAIPEIFLNIADAIPEILAGIIETVFTPEFLIRLGFAMGKAFIAVATLGLTSFAPEWGRKVGEELSKYVDFSEAAQKVAAVFSEIGNTISSFFTGFVTQLKSVFDPIIEPIERLIKALGGGSGRGLIAEAGGSGGGKGILAETFGFSKGGIVPLYAASGAFVPRGTDTVPAMLTPGERVLSVGTTGNLDTFMSSQSSGQEQTMAVLSAILQALQAPMVVNAEAKVNQSAFADIILQLNRQNMRLSA